MEGGKVVEPEEREVEGGVVAVVEQQVVFLVEGQHLNIPVLVVQVIVVVFAVCVLVPLFVLLFVPFFVLLFLVLVDGVVLLVDFAFVAVEERQLVPEPLVVCVDVFVRATACIHPPTEDQHFLWLQHHQHQHSFNFFSSYHIQLHPSIPLSALFF